MHNACLIHRPRITVMAGNAAQEQSRHNVKSRGQVKNSVIESLVTGSISSVATTVLYQPLELLKTRIQIENGAKRGSSPIFGRVTQSALHLARQQGLMSLWKGTGASLARSGPGVGLYYALLNVLQSNFSLKDDRPNSASQAFYFGLTARSIVSFMLLPVTVVKVRYESGQFHYSSLAYALKNAYLKPDGWVGVAPTVLRDSLFSGIYYMCYTKLKPDQQYDADGKESKQNPMKNFTNGIVSGIVASIVTNPIDVVKTRVQANTDGRARLSVRQVSMNICSQPGGYLRFFDGLAPRSIRRTLIAASTWTFYELMIEIVSSRM